MKKLLPFLITIISTLSINAQSPTLSFTNVTGSNSITCNVASINYIASVSNYTAGPLTYTWVSLSGTASGTNVTLSNPSTYTLTAFNIANSFSLSQVFTIGLNMIAPTSTVTPMTQNVVCGSSIIPTFTGITTSTLTNVTHAWYSQYSSNSLSNSGTVSIQQVFAPGTYTYCLTNNINGCSVCKTVTVTSSSGFPTYSITSPQQFTIGCSTTSISTINITNVTTQPTPGGPVSYTVLPPSFVGPFYSTGLSNTYSATTPGTYTVIVKDNTNACETKVQLSIFQNTIQPQITLSTSNPTLTCYLPNTLLTGTSTNTNVSFSWAFPGFGLPPQIDTLRVFTNPPGTNTIVATYTLSITDNINKCRSNQTITVFQNTKPPTASITPPNPSISCATPSILLTNSSISNVPAIFSPTLPVIGSAWYGPAPQSSLANSSNYLAYTLGNYTLTAKDLNNGCTTTVIKNVNTTDLFPLIIAPPPFNINCPNPTVLIYPSTMTSTTGLIYSWAAPATASVSSLTTPSITANVPGIYTVTATNPITTCYSTVQVTVTVCADIEQNSVSNSNINIFPNPNNGLFTIDHGQIQANSVIEIYSAYGVLIKKQAIISEKSILNLQNEANGLYFIYVISGEKAIKVSKIVKN
jgi:hypothetical protein